MGKNKRKYKKRQHRPVSKKKQISFVLLRERIKERLKPKPPLIAEKSCINKRSLIQTAVVVSLMAATAVYTWAFADEGQAWLGLSAVIILAAAVGSLYRVKYAPLFEYLLAAFTPAAVFMLTESYTHRLNQMWEGPVFLNIVIYYLFFGFMLFLIGRTGPAIIAGSLLLSVAGLANYFVIQFRSSPILPWDLYSVGVAATVADNFEYTLTVRACNVILLFILLWVLCMKMRSRIKLRRVRAGGAVLLTAAMLAFGCGVQTDKAIDMFNMDTTLFTPTVLYRNNGLVLSFIVNMRYLNIEKPAGYSGEVLAELQAELERHEAGEGTAEAAAAGEKPNIIVIMNEAFSDLSVLGDFETNTDVMPFIHSLSENTQKGWLYTSVKGGNTANTEFEFLTGMSMYYLPVGSIPYQQYIRSELPSLASQLKSAGYTSVALHPYYSTGWNRNKIYDYMGFDEKYFRDSFVNPEKLRTYISDWSTFEKIIERFEAKESDERMFFFDVTMQNHGSYVKRYDNFVPDVTVVDGSGRYLAATEQYLSLIKRSDEAFEQLVQYFANQSEPTIILMFGDHQPADYVVTAIDDGKTDEDSLSLSLQERYDRSERYKVPFIMWANYDIEENTGERTSANYLAVRLLEAAGLPLTDFQQFLKELSADVPVITAHDALIYGSEEIKGLDDYFYLQYNNLFDMKHRLENFFTYHGN